MQVVSDLWSQKSLTNSSTAPVSNTRCKCSPVGFFSCVLVQIHQYNSCFQLQHVSLFGVVLSDH